MENIVPSIDCIRRIRLSMVSGEALATALDKVVVAGRGEFYQKLRHWWFIYKNGNPQATHWDTHYQKTLISVLTMGLSGAPVMEHLELLEKEMMEEYERQVNAHLQSLPFKLLVPLLLFFFPAFVILLFGPLIQHFLLEVGL